MVILITGDTHTGKTLLAQKLLEKYKFPYFSIDHLKMGLIRSGLCQLQAESDDNELTAYLWPIVREIIKTCVENSQNIIVEGCYIPFNWKADFPSEYTKAIRHICLIFDSDYVNKHFEDILRHENAIEKRRPSNLNPSELRESNEHNLRQCLSHGCRYLLIDDNYTASIERFLSEDIL